MKTYKTYRADLWGNNDDGYDVNDWYPLCTIELSESNTGTDKELMQKIVKSGLFTPNSLTANYEIEHQEHEFYVRFRNDDTESLYKFEEVSE